MIHHSPRHALLAAVAIATAAIVSIASPVRLQAQSSAPQPSAAGSQSAEYPFGFKAYGVFRNMIQQRNYLAVVALKDVVDDRSTDAVGAMSGLRGEISMIEGKLIVSYGADCGTACPSAATETATLLATATTRSWRPVPIDKDLDAKATETFIREQAKANGLDENKPFPFRINGAITNFVMHVNAAPNPRFKGHGSFDEMAITGLAKGPRLAGSVVGFYAPPALQGVITHMGDFFHSHYVDEQRATTAHLDSFGIAAGSTLMLPREE
jgi:acetolactate decarboxylase